MTINLSVLGTYATGIFNSGAAESAAYDGDLQRLFVVNRTTQAIDVLSLSDPADPFRLFSIDVTPFGPNPSSVAVSSTGIVAVAVEGPTPQEPGSVVFFDTLGQFLGSVPVGATPRALTFTPDGSRLLVANAGEPSADYTVDPEGSISIIDLTAGPAAAIAQTVGFAAFNEQQATLSAAGVRIFGPGASVAQDLEPEAIALSGDSLTAYITLQENNAVATLDLATATITEITPLGTQDHSLPGNELDASNIDGAINIAPAPVQGLYQPGAIATYTVNGETFWVLANEGASRASVGFNEEATVGGLVLDPVAFPPVAVPPVTEPPVIEPPVTEPPVTEPPVTGPPVTEPPVTEPPVAPPPVMQQIDPALGNLTVSTVGADIDGNGAVDQLFSFGSRSFSIRTAATNIETAVPTGSIVYDSGAAFEQITAAEFPQFFNADNTINTVDTFDARSDDSGPEPNGIVVGQVGDRTYSFTTLEQIGGVVVYDITDPANASFVQYINNRDFSGIPMTSTAGDLGPENPTFIAAEDSPTGGALLAIPNAVSGTTSVYGIFTAVDESTEVIINEIRTNQPGANSDHFFELLGTPNTSLDGLTYIVIGDGDTTVVDTDGDGIADATAGSGVIEEVVDLSGSVLNGDGLFVAAENTFTLGSADLTTTLNFEDNDNVTHLLVRDFTGGLDQDLDTDDDGVLDVVPWTEIFDSVAIVRSTTSGEQIYSESIVGPLQGIFAPGHVFRQPVEDPEVPEEPPIGEMPGGEVPGEEPPVGEMPVGEVPGGEVPGEEPPVGEMPVGEMPVGEVPGEEPPVGEMPVGEIPGEEVPGEEVPRNSALLSRAGEFQIGGFSPDEGLDTPGRANDEIAVAAAIFEIQGAERTSPLEGQLVITTGIVTAIAEDGFYFQDAIGDGDDATSDGLFVFTGILPNLLIGDEVNVVGTVSEFTPGGPDSGNLSTTQLINPDVVRLSGGNPLPTAVIIGEGGRIPPTELIDNAPPAEEPGMETPGMEIPGMEPGMEDPGMETPGMEDPGVEAPGMEIPGMEPGVEVPGMETPGMETPDMEIPGMEPGMEDPGAETPGMETPGMDPGAEAPGMETPGMEPGMEIPGMEEPEIEPITGIDFFESLEGMRVTVVAPQVVGATNRFGEIYTFAAGTEPTGLSDRGTLNISPTDFNPERIQIDPDSITSPVTAPLVDVGATLSDVTGVVGYSFGNYEVIPTEVFTVVEDIPVEEMPPMEEVPGAEMPGAEMPGEIPGAEMPGEIPGEMPSEMPGEMPGEMPEPPAIEPVVEEVSLLTPTADQITIASYNVLNLDPVVENVANVAGQDPDEVDDDVANGRFTAIANDIITNLNTPDIIGLQEIQDSDGAEITDISSADLTYQTLIDEIAAAGGPTYQFIDTPGLVPASVDEAGNVLRPTGGQPGGNIRVGYLYNPDRVSLVEGSVVPLTDPVDQAVNPDNPFFGSRIPLAATFLFNGQEVTVVNNHFSSKSGSAPLFGTIQPAVELQSDPAAGVNGGLDERIAQAEAVQAFVGSLLAADPDANVVALGDFNEFEFLPPLEILEQDLFNLTNTLAENERYSFIFQGNSQAIDHILVSNSLADQAEFDAVHINAEFAETPQRASDHDPLLARLTIAPPVGLPPVVEPPVVEPPVVEPPVVEPPIAEPPVVGPPTTELPIVEPPIVEPPIVEAPVMEPPAPELPPAAPPEIAIPTPGIAPPVLPPVISPLLGLSDSSGGLLGDISPAAEPSLI